MQTKNSWAVTLANGGSKYHVLIIGVSLDEAIAKATVYAKEKFSPGSMHYVEAIQPGLQVVVD